MADDGVGLALYHEWDIPIPQACKDTVTVARLVFVNEEVDTGW